MTVNDSALQERYVALQAWLVGQMSPRAPHAADLFAQDRECLYAAFLSVLVGTGLGFADFDDNRAHHGLYAFDFFVGDLEAPPRGRGVDGPRASVVAGDSATDAAVPAMCHALVDTWLGETGRRIPFVASVIASVATLELVADVSVDGCVFECDLLPGYARSTANYPWEDGSLPIGSLDSSLVIPGPLIYVEAGVRYEGQVMSCLGVDEAVASWVQMGLSVESSTASSTGVTAVLRAPHGGPEMLGWAAGVVSDRRAVAHNEAPASSVETRPGQVARGEVPYALVFSAATGASSFQKSSSSGFRPIEEALKEGSRPALRWAT